MVFKKCLCVNRRSSIQKKMFNSHILYTIVPSTLSKSVSSSTDKFITKKKHLYKKTARLLLSERYKRRRSEL